MVHSAKRRCRKPALRSSADGPASLSGLPCTRRLFGPVRGLAVPEPCGTGPKAAGTAAHSDPHRAVLPAAALSAAARAVGGCFAVRSPAGLVAGSCLGRGCRQPDHRAASASRGDPAGAGAADARKRCHAGKTDRRRIRSFAERRVFLGEPELSGRAARGGSSRRKTGARHRRREGRRRLCQSGRNSGPHQSCQRDDACCTGTDCGGLAITHWYLPHRAGRNADL